MVLEKDKPILIGIDPDVKANGFAMYDKWDKTLLRLDTLDLTDLFGELDICSAQNTTTVHLEAGWLLGATWHKGGNTTAKRIGANHEIGRQIEKYLVKKNIDYKLIKPQGYSSYNHEKFCMITKWPIKVRTNSETRVAGMLVYGY